ncbi:hypothetical protein BDR26DRAFT_857234 [Obelidium mucronatum]|nr:hypothetical protein BDR26DRAFT_857234 [Obelidium mucronatum]
MNSTRAFARFFQASTVRRAHTSVAQTFTENNPASFPSVKDTMLKPNFHEYQHAHGSTNTWFWINVIVTVPALVAVGSYSIPIELEHMKHLLAHPREYEDLPYMRKRKNPFPWGDKNLFYHPHANPDPPSA